MAGWDKGGCGMTTGITPALRAMACAEGISAMRGFRRTPLLETATLPCSARGYRESFQTPKH